MSKHTPGPWRVEVGGSDADYALQFPVILSDGYEVVGTEGFYSGDLSVDIANANLCAAAPELLEALVKVVRWMESPSEGAFSDAELAKAKKAIAKAEGKV